MSDLEATKRAVLETVRAMDREGLTEGTAGNVSARTDDGRVVLTPTAMGYAEMNADDLVVTDLDGRILAGTRPPTTEASLHLGCLRRHADIAAVVHTHAIHATMFAINHTEIPCVVEEFEFQVGGDVTVAPYHRTGSDALGEAAAERLGDRAAVLLANHGLVTVGDSPAQALQITRLVERTARIVWGARAMGKPRALPDPIRAEFAAIYRTHRAQAAAARASSARAGEG